MKDQSNIVHKTKTAKTYWTNPEYKGGLQKFIGDYEFVKVGARTHRVLILREALNPNENLVGKKVLLVEVFESHEKAKKAGWKKN